MFTNYERLLLELNDKLYYDQRTYDGFLEENGLDPRAKYSKDKDKIQLLETTYEILHTLLSDIDLYRKIETEFATTSEAATSLNNRLEHLKAEIKELKLEQAYANGGSDFTFMYYTR